MNSKALHIHIDRLLVEGLTAGQQRRFVRALETQLEAQLPQLAGQAFASGRPSQHIPRLNVAAPGSGSSPERAASQITSALRGAIAGKGNSRA